MFSQMFGAYLVKEHIITQEDLQDVLQQQQTARARLGTIAVSDGLLTEKEADQINHLQIQEDKRFGDIAVERGFLTQKEVEEILGKQGNSFMKFLQILTDHLQLSVAEVSKYLSEFQMDNGFTQEEMEAMKGENIDRICDLYAYASKPYVTEITALVLRNLSRFATGSFYIDKIEKVDQFPYQNIVGQRIAGDHNIYIAFGDDGGGGSIQLAAGFAGEEYQEEGPHIYDALAEFSNICSGLFSSGLSKKGVYIDMEPPFIYLNQCAVGDAYVVPIHFNDSIVKLFIAVDSPVSMGDKPYQLSIEKLEGSVVTADSKGTVVIVDDSALIRKMLRNIVEDYGYTVVSEAVNGQEAVSVYKKYQPDLITLDITMPIMDGLEALREIIDFDENAKAIMITAAGQQQKVIEALKIGAEHFIMKPFSKEKVIDSLEGVLGVH